MDPVLYPVAGYTIFDAESNPLSDEISSNSLCTDKQHCCELFLDDPSNIFSFQMSSCRLDTSSLQKLAALCLSSLVAPRPVRIKNPLYSLLQVSNYSLDYILDVNLYSILF